MASASPPSGYGQPASLRRRAVSFALAALANVLLLVMLLTLATSPSRREPPETRTTTVTLLPDEVVSAKDATRAVSKRPRSTAAARPRARPDAKTPAPPQSTVVSPEPPPLNMILMDRQSFAATDISRMPAAPGAGANGTAAAGQDRSGDSELAGGKGPGGEPLYRAEWFRRPSHADLAGYSYSKGPGTGWGEIACRTAPGYRVEACVELAQSPPDSGLARIVRDAAPNFRVRPPRIGGRPLVGTWVRIRIDYSERDAA